MKTENKVEYYCINCEKKLKSLKSYNKCFNKNHTISVEGCITVDNTLVEDYLINKRINTKSIKKGIALTNAKAGEEVIIRLE